MTILARPPSSGLTTTMSRCKLDGLANDSADSDAAGCAVSKLLSDERNLLRYYAEAQRILHGAERGAVHQHLLRMGFIEEKTFGLKGAMIIVTEPGRSALGFGFKRRSVALDADSQGSLL
jgi:hypothetical protein